ncbi:MAG: leucine-rich repeat protein [Lachnospiraceae bacterium]|nr:leucine-rich repeat protein [Lachnospiraceae bacterium]
MKKIFYEVLFSIMLINIISVGLSSEMSRVYAENYREEAVKLAASQVGYREKASPEYLDDFTANSGSNNYTKYARDLWVTNGLPWGATFFWWIMMNTCVPRDAYPRSTVVSKMWFEERGLFRKAEEYIPQMGDCVILGNAVNYGIVENVSSDSVTIIAGNRGETDAVTRFTLSLDDPYIAGYGIIDYDYNKQPEGLDIGENICALLIRKATLKTIKNSGSDVVLWDEAARADYRWLFNRQEDGSYKIQSLYDGKFLTVENGGRVNGTNVCVQSDMGDDNSTQKWYLTRFWDEYRLIPQSIPHFSLDVVYDNDNYNGMSLKIWYQGDGPTQLFSINQIDYYPLEDIHISGNDKENMCVGDSRQLSYSLIPENASADMVVWSSSDPLVAEVDSNGLVTSKQKGYVTISCTSTYDSSISGSVTILVNDEEEETEASTEQTTEDDTEQSTEAPVEKPTETGTEQSTEAPMEKPTEAVTEKPSEILTEKPTEQKNKVEIGTRIKDRFCYYEITSVKNKKVKVVEIRNKKTAVLQIPAKVKYEGKSYQITSITKGAFRNNKRLKRVTIGDHVEVVGDCAFAGCTKLNKIVIGKNTISIGQKAFYGCKRLKQIQIRSVRLKKVGKNAFKKISKRPVVWAPKKKIKAYKKLFKGKF